MDFQLDRVGRKLEAKYDFIDLDFSKQVAAIKPGMYVVFNRLREKFIVMDRDIQGTPYIFMVVQEPDSSFRAFDERTLTNIRKSIQQSPEDIVEQLTGWEKEREHRVDAETEDLAYGMADHLKWFGRAVVGSLAQKARSISYEEKVAMREKIHALSN